MRQHELHPWRIWFRYLDQNGVVVSAGVSTQTYLRKWNAVRAANKRYSSPVSGFVCQWIVAKENPWPISRNYQRAK